MSRRIAAMSLIGARFRASTAGSRPPRPHSPACSRFTRRSPLARLTPRPPRSPHLEYSPLVERELGVVAAAAGARRRFGAATVSKYVISHCEAVSDLLEVGVLLREAGLLRSSGPQLDVIPLFESIADL